MGSLDVDTPLQVPRCCENGPTSGQSEAELRYFWQKFMIEGMNRTAGLKFLERTCCVSYECLVHTIVFCGDKI